VPASPRARRRTPTVCNNADTATAFVNCAALALRLSLRGEDLEGAVRALLKSITENRSAVIVANALPIVPVPWSFTPSNICGACMSVAPLPFCY